MKETTNLTPRVQPIQNRIATLDTLRGFAMLGIFLSIIHSFNGSILYGSAAPSGPLDQVIGFLESLFISKRFIGLLSLLFGLGIAIQQLNFQSKGVPFTGYFVRRMLLLGVFGLVNTTFYFNGEILLVYAVFGLVVIGLSRLPRGFLISIAVFFFLVWGQLFEALVRDDFIEWFSWLKEEYPARRVKAIYTSSAFGEMARLRWLEYAYIYTDNNFHMGMSLSMILAGYLIGIEGWHTRFLDGLNAFRRPFGLAVSYTAVFGVFGLATGQSDFIFVYNPIGYLFYAVFLLSSLFAYVYMVVWWGTQFGGTDPVSKTFAIIGRIPLTAYMGGALIFSLVFYGHGLGLFMQHGTTAISGIALLVYAFFALFGALWLKRFRRGPMEWLFRKLAYAGK